MRKKVALALAGVVVSTLVVRSLGRMGKRRRKTPMTPATSPVNAADSDIGRPGENEENRLDEALEESFPASDPVSIRIE